MKYIVCAFAFFLLATCNKWENPPTPVDTSKLTTVEKDSLIRDLNFEFGAPMFVDSSTYFIVPLKMSPWARKNRGGSLSSDSYFSSKYYGNSNNASWNLLFCNQITGSPHKLSNKKMVILKVDLNRRKTGSKLKEFIFYRIIDTDTNRDGDVNFDDKSNLFYSSVSGKNLTRLTPKDEQLKSYSFIPDTEQLMVHTIRDGDKNGKIDSKDDNVLYILTLSQEPELKEILNPDFGRSLKEMYFDQWIPKVMPKE